MQHFCTGKIIYKKKILCNMNATQRYTMLLAALLLVQTFTFAHGWELNCATGGHLSKNYPVRLNAFKSAAPAIPSNCNLSLAELMPPQAFDSVFGYVFYDVDQDCIQDAFETTGYAGWLVTLTIFGNGAVLASYTTQTDANGYYVFNQIAPVPGFAGANVSVQPPPPPNALWCGNSQCPTVQTFNPNSANYYHFDFGLHCDTLPPCPIMDVDIATYQIRPCSTSYFVVDYCNAGLVTATDASVEVTIDPALTVTGSSQPWSSANGNVYTFDLGDLGAGQCGFFQINATAPCNDPVGTTYCVEAHAFPDSCSLPAGPNWDGSEIQVTAVCTGDSVIFTIRNAGAGDMSQELDYVVAEDNVMLMAGHFQLNAGAFANVALPADGSYFRLQADQSPGFPGLNLPIAWVEGCGGNGSNTSLGFVNQYQLGDQETWLDVFCMESVNSFDPNDKQGFPRGYGDQHFVDQNTDIEYLIRFQNTGTAPALNIELRDALPVQWLDPASVRPGASSHPYTWDLQGNGELVFQFAGINLPDSSADLEASQGFVKFTVSQRPDVALNTVIENTAAIFFDNNPAVITNTTWHTVGKDFVEMAASGIFDPTLTPALRVFMSPQPANDKVRVQLEGLEQTDQLRVKLFSPVGRLVTIAQVNGPAFDLNLSELPSGVYFYQIEQAGRPLAAGKLIRMQ